MRFRARSTVKHEQLFAFFALDWVHDTILIWRAHSTIHWNFFGSIWNKRKFCVVGVSWSSWKTRVQVQQDFFLFQTYIIYYCWMKTSFSLRPFGEKKGWQKRYMEQFRSLKGGPIEHELYFSLARLSRQLVIWPACVPSSSIASSWALCTTSLFKGQNKNKVARKIFYWEKSSYQGEKWKFYKNKWVQSEFSFIASLGPRVGPLVEMQRELQTQQTLEGAKQPKDNCSTATHSIIPSGTHAAINCLYPKQ